MRFPVALNQLTNLECIDIKDDCAASDERNIDLIFTILAPKSSLKSIKISTSNKSLTKNGLAKIINGLNKLKELNVDFRANDLDNYIKLSDRLIELHLLSESSHPISEDFNDVDADIHSPCLKTLNIGPDSVLMNVANKISQKYIGNFLLLILIQRCYVASGGQTLNAADFVDIDNDTPAYNAWFDDCEHLVARDVKDQGDDYDDDDDDRIPTESPPKIIEAMGMIRKLQLLATTQQPH
ncbi:unnamed protein product [Rotaria sp. Silwood2]|nr:unnamed protein product [Rotaria sp. Silwood2]